MSSVITNTYNKKTKGPTSMELFTATGKLKTGFFFPTTGDIRTMQKTGPEPVQRHLQRLMVDHLISACADTQFQ